jgi:hypothetical protein
VRRGWNGERLRLHADDVQRPRRELRNDSQRLRWDPGLWDLHRTADVWRRWRLPSMRLHADHAVPCGDELRDRSRRLRRNRELRRSMSGPRYLRRRRDGQRLRVYAKGLSPGALQRLRRPRRRLWGHRQLPVQRMLLLL